MRWPHDLGKKLWTLAALSAFSCASVCGGAVSADESAPPSGAASSSSTAPAAPNLEFLGRVAPAPPDVSKVLPKISAASVNDSTPLVGPVPKRLPRRLPAPTARRTSPQRTAAQFVRFQAASETGDPKYDLNIDLKPARILGNFGSSRVDISTLPAWESTAEEQVQLSNYATDRVVEPTNVRSTIGTDGVESPWGPQAFVWTAPGVSHNPLYFEEINLERYGHSAGWRQPITSGAHFFGTLAILPYKLGAYPRCENLYVLGHHRPGSCNPHQIQWVPFSWRGLLYQGGATVGGAYYLP